MSDKPAKQQLFVALVGGNFHDAAKLINESFADIVPGIISLTIVGNYTQVVYRAPVESLGKHWDLRAF